MKRSIFSLLLVVFIDAAGIGILFPILNNIIMNTQVDFLQSQISLSQRHFYYGLVVAVFFLCWFFGATFIAKASDELGRKKALVICLAGIFAGYGLTILAIKLKSLSLLILGRVLGGLTAASQPVAQAAIIDLSDQHNKTKNLGLIMFAFSLGLVAGPLLGGFLSDEHLSLYFNNATPFYVILVITLINLYLLRRHFSDSRQYQGKLKLNLVEMVTQFVPMFKLKQVRNLSLVFFIMQLAFNTFYVFIPVFLFQKYGFNTFKNSLMMLVLGLSMAVSTGYLVAKLQPCLGDRKSVAIGLIVMAVSLFLLITINNAYVPYLLAIPAMLAFGLAYTSMLSLFSHSVDESRQGWVMGITVSLFTSGAALTSLFGGWLMTLDINATMIVAISGFVVSLLLIAILHIDVSEQKTAYDSAK
ncbi:MAG: MFS transporter [Francisellaceae bacterium]